MPFYIQYKKAYVKKVHWRFYTHTAGQAIVNMTENIFKGAYQAFTENRNSKPVEITKSIVKAMVLEEEKDLEPILAQWRSAAAAWLSLYEKYVFDPKKIYARVYEEQSQRYKSLRGSSVAAESDYRAGAEYMASKFTAEKRNIAVSRLKEFISDIDTGAFTAVVPSCKIQFSKGKITPLVVAPTKRVEFCANCGVLIPTPSCFRFGRGTVKREPGVSLCPFCVVSLYDSAKQLQDNLIKEDPTIYDEYQTQRLLQSLK